MPTFSVQTFSGYNIIKNSHGFIYTSSNETPFLLIKTSSTFLAWKYNN